MTPEEIKLAHKIAQYLYALNDPKGRDDYELLRLFSQNSNLYEFNYFLRKADFHKILFFTTRSMKDGKERIYGVLPGEKSVPK